MDSFRNAERGAGGRGGYRRGLEKRLDFPLASAGCSFFEEAGSTPLEEPPEEQKSEPHTTRSVRKPPSGTRPAAGFVG